MEAGDILVKRGLLDSSQLPSIRAKAAGGRFVDAAIEMGLVKEEDALRALGNEVGIDYIDLTSAEVEIEEAQIREALGHKLVEAKRQIMQEQS